VEIYRTVFWNTEDFRFQYFAVRHHDDQIRCDCQEFLNEFGRAGSLWLQDLQTVLPGELFDG